MQDLLEMRTRELRESEARFRNAMDATQDGLWEWDMTSGANNGILDDGVNFIQKPFSIKELAEKVRETLG